MISLQEEFAQHQESKKLGKDPIKSMPIKRKEREKNQIVAKKHMTIAGDTTPEIIKDTEENKTPLDLTRIMKMKNA